MSRSGKFILYLAYFAIVAALSAIIITASKSNQPAPPKASAPKVATHSTSKKPAASTPKTSPKPAPTASSSPSPAPAPAPAPTASATTLTDTGPGNVAGVFVVVSLGGTLLYRRRLIAKADS